MTRNAPRACSSAHSSVTLREGVGSFQAAGGHAESGVNSWVCAQGKTAFSYVPETAELLAAHSFFLQNHPPRSDPPVSVLSLLQGLLASVIEVLHLWQSDPL